ncbi:MAG: fibronectin type III domain-containing protein [archaeon]
MASVSASHLVIFVASVLVAASVAGTLTNTVGELRGSVGELGLDVNRDVQTDIEIINDRGSTVYNRSGDENVTLYVKNTGAERLPADSDAIDVYLDDTFVDAVQLTPLEGDDWRPNSVVRLDVSAPDLGDGFHQIRLLVNGDEEFLTFGVGAVVDETPPTEPQNLTVTATSTGSIDLSWDPASDDETGVHHYNVYVNGSSTPSVQSRDTTAVVSELSADTSYDVEVSAVDYAGNEGPRAGPVTATTDAGAGDTVSGENWTATLTEVNSSALEFAFDHDEDATWVDVHYSVNGGAFQSHRMEDHGGYHTYTATDTGDGTGFSSGDDVEYYFTYEIDAVANDTDQYFYTFEGGSADDTAPTEPTNLTGSTVSETEIDLDWDASTDDESGVDHYNVYIDGKEYPSVQTENTSVTVGKLDSGTTYSFTVTAVDAAGNESPESDSTEVRTDG